jgi:hypothetical protein
LPSRRANGADRTFCFSPLRAELRSASRSSRSLRRQTGLHPPRGAVRHVVGWENTSFHGKRDCAWGSNRRNRLPIGNAPPKARNSAVTYRSEFRAHRPAHIRQKPWMRRPALRKVGTRSRQAQLTVHRQPNLGSVLVLLPVILPPAHGAQPQRRRSLQRPVSATRATKPRLHLHHQRWTPIRHTRITTLNPPRKWVPHPGGVFCR